MTATTMRAGFADPVFDSQSVFRSALDCMAHPGRMASVAPDGLSPPAALPLAAAALALALADYETPIFLGASLNHSEISAWLSFHTGAPFTTDPAAAAFVLMNADEVGSLSALAAGDDRYPDRSATLVLLCASLEGGDAVTLSGPGIRSEKRVSPKGVGATLWRDFALNAARYPLGFDTFFVSGGDLMALPRSTRISFDGDA